MMMMMTMVMMMRMWSRGVSNEGAQTLRANEINIRMERL
jgi:hypothetical protein